MISPPVAEKQQATPRITVSAMTFTQPLTEADAATVLNVSARTLQKWRYEARGPAYFKEGNVVRYPAESLKTYIDQKVVRHD